MRNSNVVASILMLVIAAILWPQMKHLTYFGIVFPRAVIVALVAAAVLLLLLTLMRREAGRHDIQAPNLGTVAIVVALMAVWIAIMPWLGFYVTSVAVFGLLMLVIDPSVRNAKSFFVSLAGVAIELAIFYVAFSTLLEVPLPRGILF